jgi:hypothetical protein
VEPRTCCGRLPGISSSQRETPEASSSQWQPYRRRLARRRRCTSNSRRKRGTIPEEFSAEKNFKSPTSDNDTMLVVVVVRLRCWSVITFRGYGHMCHNHCFLALNVHVGIRGRCEAGCENTFHRAFQWPTSVISLHITLPTNLTQRCAVELSFQSKNTTKIAKILSTFCARLFVLPCFWHVDAGYRKESRLTEVGLIFFGRCCASC